MTKDEFERLLARDAPGDSWTPALKAMWYDRKGDWESAHALVQEEDSEASAWVHAYLHRKEGDLQNAGYWYRRCGRPVCGDTLGREWARITRALL